MNFITKTLNKLFKSSNQLELNKIKPIVAQINDLEKNFINYKTQDFIKKTNELKKNVLDGRSYEDILPEAFALVREASKQVLGERHFDVQLAGGIFLHRGCVAEMKTGEGKTLVSTLPAYLNALGGKGVHIVTVNDYLAKRDSEWMGKVFNYLGISTGCIVNELNDIERKKNYSNDITYATNNELGFDYLRDNMKYSKDELVLREHNFAIVDEIDSCLIDEARTPLVISGAAEDKTMQYIAVDKLIKNLKNTDFDLDEKEKNIRAILNFGHTFAHALETKFNYSSKIIHGEAVLIGMIVACKISLNKKFLSIQDFERIINFYKVNKLNYNYKAFINKKNIKIFLKIIKNDKKFKGKKINLILLKKIGQSIIRSSDINNSFMPLVK